MPATPMFQQRAPGRRSRGQGLHRQNNRPTKRPSKRSARPAKRDSAIASSIARSACRAKPSAATAGPENGRRANPRSGHRAPPADRPRRSSRRQPARRTWARRCLQSGTTGNRPAASNTRGPHRTNSSCGASPVRRAPAPIRSASVDLSRHLRRCGKLARTRRRRSAADHRATATPAADRRASPPCPSKTQNGVSAIAFSIDRSPTPRKRPANGCRPDEQQMENENGQSESIVVGGSHHVAQLQRLQLGRREVRRADGAVERATPGRELERVAIDHPHAHSFVDKQIALIDVAHDDIRRVERLKRGGRVSRGEHHVVPAGIRKVPSPVRRAVQLVKLPGAIHLRHQEAARLARHRIEKHRLRPGRDRLQRARPARNHGLNLRDLLLGQRPLMVDLGQQRRLSVDFVYGPLASSAELLPQGDRPGDGVKQYRLRF